MTTTATTAAKKSAAAATIEINGTTYAIRYDRRRPNPGQFENTAYLTDPRTGREFSAGTYPASTYARESLEINARRAAARYESARRARIARLLSHAYDSPRRARIYTAPAPVAPAPVAPSARRARVYPVAVPKCARSEFIRYSRPIDSTIDSARADFIRDIAATGGAIYGEIKAIVADRTATRIRYTVRARVVRDTPIAVEIKGHGTVKTGLKATRAA